MSITMQQIAKRLGVSRTTVYRALNNLPRINESTKKKILREVKKLNYRPNAVARGLALQRTYTFGLIIPDITNPFFSELTQSIENNAARKGYNIILGVSEDDPKKEAAHISIFRERRVDGIIISPIYAHMKRNRNIEEIREDKIPYVVLGCPKTAKVDYVIVDEERGAYKIIEHLINLGHKRIAYICGAVYAVAGLNRLEGYKKALKRYGLKFDKNLVINCGPKMVDGYKAAKKILTVGKNRPTAIFALNDLLAIGVLKAIREAGLKVPEDVALVGFDDIEVGAFLEVPLTTIIQPKRKMGKMALEILIDKIEQKNPHGLQQIIIEPKIVIRESCGAKD